VALERGQVDCGITWEPVTTAVVDRGIARILTDLNTEQACRDFFGGEYAQAGLIAQPETVDARSGVLAKVLAAFDEALQWMAGHDAEEIVALIPQEAVADRATYARALSRQKFIFPASTKVDPRAMENVVAFFREAGMIPAGMPLRAQDFLRPAATARAAVPGVGPLKGKDGVLQPVVLVGAVLGLLLVVVLVVLSRTKKRGARG
jgi:ABC-type nitrate/sulfonate/bicarbonate transport system substrate-binding protein